MDTEEWLNRLSDDQPAQTSVDKLKSVYDKKTGSLVVLHIDKLSTALKDAEAIVIEHAYRACKYNQSRTAKALNISRGCLRMKLKEYFGETYL